MDQLVSGEWLEKELGAPDLRVLDPTRSRSRQYRTGPATGVPQFHPPELRNARWRSALARNEPAFLSSTCRN